LVAIGDSGPPFNLHFQFPVAAIARLFGRGSGAIPAITSARQGDIRYVLM
jgi:hypothetical protein